MTAEVSQRRAVLTLDPVDERARLGDATLSLTPKAFAVLSHLAAHRERLVTKAELLSTLWPETAVSDGVLTTVIREIRRALGEGSQRPSFIQTVHRRGYRFIGDVRTTDAWPFDAGSTLPIVGREAELERLDRWLGAARGGARQIVFIAGEPGVGKTAVLDAFIARAASRPSVRIARGQCVESYGETEAYLPWLDALGRLCRGRHGAAVIAVLRRVAPMWLAQLPALIGAEEREGLLRQVSGAPPERMLRELADALEELTRDEPLVVALEDLHWGDRSSLDLLASVARRREPARLLLLGTLRPAEVGAAAHPLRGIKQELEMHRQCAELPLEFLSAGAVAKYLSARFPGLPDALGRAVHRRTDGNALFMVSTADYLLARGLIAEDSGRWQLLGEVRVVEAAVPESLRALIDRQLDRLSAEDRSLLNAASVAGAEFADAALAPALELSVERVSERCAALARSGLFLRFTADDDWPDGTATRRYAFIHALFADVLYEALTPSQRVRLHLSVGERLESGYGARQDEIAAELATHFERGRDTARAVAALSHSASNAVQRLAYPEAIRALTRALELLAVLPEDALRVQREFSLRMALAPLVMVTKGYAALEVDEAYARAEALSRQAGDDRQLFSVLMGRCSSVLLMGRIHEARRLAEECQRIALARKSPRYLTQAETAVGIARFFQGELAAAAADLDRSRLAYEAVKQRPPGFRLLHDPSAAGRSYAAWAHWLLGFPELARVESEAAVGLARGLDHPFSLAFALAFGAFVYQARRDVARTLERAEQTIAVCREYGFAMYLAVGQMFLGWTLAEQGRNAEGLQVMEQGLVDYGATGALLVQPYFLALIAELHLHGGESERALAAVDRGLEIGERTGERIYLTELHRIGGEATALHPQERAPWPSAAAEAERRFLQALAIAREQHAKSLELRVAMSLARHWQAADRAADAAALLSETHRWFKEGLETPDLRSAAELLERLARA
jgi:DNA-binding winged helix-turn-helix (wHTH) protein/predicted ATPase